MQNPLNNAEAQDWGRIVRELQNFNTAGFEDRGKAISQRMWTALEAGKDRVTDFPPSSSRMEPGPADMLHFSPGNPFWTTDCRW